jgi:ornithine carbamoyltransferase
VINALSDLHHPLQALADILTLQVTRGCPGHGHDSMHL